MGFDSPLAFTGVQHQVLVVLGADRELVLCRVEDVEQQVTLSGAVERDRQTDRVWSQCGGRSVHSTECKQAEFRPDFIVHTKLLLYTLSLCRPPKRRIISR